MSGLPSEAEVRAFAEAIGAVDGDGNYTENRRRLVLGAIEYRDELEQAFNEPASTLEQLLIFLTECSDHQLDRELTRDLLVAVAQGLVTRQGLRLKGNPHHGN